MYLKISLTFVIIFFIGCFSSEKMLSDNFPMFISIHFEKWGERYFIVESFSSKRNGIVDIKLYWHVRKLMVKEDGSFFAFKYKKEDQKSFNPYRVEYLKDGYILYKRLIDDDLDNTPTIIEELIDGKWIIRNNK